MATTQKTQSNGAARLPDITSPVQQTFGIDCDMQVPASASRPACAGYRRGYRSITKHHARDPRRLCLQPPASDLRLSWHGQVDAHRAGGGAAQLAVHPRQPRQPDRRIDLVGKDAIVLRDASR